MASASLQAGSHDECSRLHLKPLTQPRMLMLHMSTKLVLFLCLTLILYFKKCIIFSSDLFVSLFCIGRCEAFCYHY